MPKQSSLLVAAALVSMSPLGVMAEEARPTFRLAMMDMMPMGGGGAMAPSAPAMPGMGGGAPAQAQNQMPMGGGGAMAPSAPGTPPMPGMGDKMDDNMMRMGGSMPAQGQNQMPMGQMPQPAAMGMCPMMAMMQNMMRMGGGQQGMPPMQGGGASGGGMGMGMTGGGVMTDGSRPGGGSAARLEGRIAFLRTDLRITDAQRPAWESFANTLRAGRDHLEAARIALHDSSTGADPMVRLESYEAHLKARAEAIHTTRMAFNTLYSQLDDAQKRMATATMLPFIGAF